MATQQYPRDRFDIIPADLERVGAHRAPGRKSRGWLWIVWCAVAVAVIVGGGWLFLHFANGDSSAGAGDSGSAAGSTSTPGATGTTRPTPTTSATPTSSPTPTPTATQIPSTPIAVLNGVGTRGLAAAAKAKLAGAGWTSVIAADAPQTGIQTTTVYYLDDSERGLALGVAQALGVQTVTKAPPVSASITQHIVVVLGADFTG
jgi:hypothetical protein